MFSEYDLRDRLVGAGGDFRDNLRAYLRSHDSINTDINITNNQNNNGRTGRTIPNIQE